MAELTEQTMRAIVTEETSDMRSDIHVLKSDVAELKTDVSELKTDVSVLKTDVSELKTGVKSLHVMFEAFDHKMDAIAELVSTTIETRKGERELQERMTVVEADIALLKHGYGSR